MRLRYGIVAIAILAATACVDEEFRLDEVSTEVSIGGDVTALPIGYLEKQKLGDIIDLDDVEGLQMDQNGNYSLAFDGDGDEISIDGIENKFDIEKTITTFSTEYPSFDITAAECVINQPFDIMPDFGSLNIPQGISVPVTAGFPVKAEEEGEIADKLEYDVPEYLKAVKRIYLKPQAQGDKGAAVKLLLDLNDLAVVNGGGEVTMELIANDGYELYDSKGNKLQEIDHVGHTSTYQVAKNYAIAASVETIEFTVYIASVANDAQVQNNKLSIPIEFGYHVSFNLTTQSGTLTLNKKPELHVNAVLQYQDADIVLNRVSLLEHGSMADNATSITLDDIPEEVKSVKKITFSDHSPMHLLSEGLDWLEDVTAEHIIIEAQLPEYLTLHDDEQHGYDAATHTLRTSLSDLRHKIDINLDALTFAGEGLKPENGVMTLNFTPDIAAYIEEDTEAKLSTLLHSKEIEFSAGFGATTLELVSLEGQVGYKYEEHTTIEMGGIEEDIDFSIANAGLSPVVTLRVDNPLSLGAKVSARLTPVFGGVAKSENAVSISNVEIKAATMEGGAIQSASTMLILADESLRENYTDAKYTFVACDLGKLLVGNIPDEVKLDVEFSTDENVTHTIYVTDNYTISYGYDVSIPLAFNNNLSLTIEDTAEDLADTFEDVADQNITIGDVALIADVASTIPLDFEFEAELLNAQGEPTVAKLDIPKSNNTLKGSADGKTEANSTLRLGLKLGKDGNISQLAEIDAIRFKLVAKRSHSGSASLNAEQYISVKLKLEISGKINADLDNI